MAYSNLLIGEILVLEFSKNETSNLNVAKKHLVDAHEAFKKNTSVLTDDEHARVCITLSNLYRKQEDLT